MTLNGGLFPGKCKSYFLELVVTELEKLYIVLFKHYYASSSGTVVSVPCSDSKVILSKVEFLLPQS